MTLNTKPDGAKLLDIKKKFLILNIYPITDKNVITEKTFPSGKDYSGNILPEIQILLGESNLTIKNIDAIAFGAGPGSFTGIRVACGIAYGIAYANNLPIIGMILE